MIATGTVVKSGNFGLVSMCNMTAAKLGSTCTDLLVLDRAIQETDPSFLEAGPKGTRTGETLIREKLRENRIQ
jgi:hypothetical protein